MDDPGRLWWDGASEQSLARILDPPAAECVEAGVAAPRARLRCAAWRGHLVLHLTARSAYLYPVARIFAVALQHRLNLPADLHERVRTALQEALMNALLHGALRLGPGGRDSLRALAALGDAIEAKFATRPTAHSLIRVEAAWTRAVLEVSVTDNGPGFRPPEQSLRRGRAAARHSGSGRGLIILRSLCDRVTSLKGGRTVALRFSRSRSRSPALRVGSRSVYAGWRAMNANDPL